VGPPSKRLSSNRLALTLGAVVVTTLVGGALLAPAVSNLLGSLLNGPVPPFSRIFDRLSIGILLVLLVAWRRRLGIGRISELWRAESWSERGRRVAAGLAASLVPALLVMAPAIEMSALLWAGRTALQAAEKMAAAIPVALVVGLVEESFFRVVVFRGLATGWRWPVAAAASSALYSVVHFLVPREGFELVGPSPLEGLRYLGAVIARAFEPGTLPALVGLFLIGLVLCLALQQGRSLALVVGLHGGWLLAAKAAIRLTALPPELADGGSLVKRQLLMGSPWLWLAIVVTAAIVVGLTRSSDPDVAGSAD
jgi:membrane protease YdiL (CAAX protease family)